MTSETPEIPDFSWANVDKQAKFSKIALFPKAIIVARDNWAYVTQLTNSLHAKKFFRNRVILKPIKINGGWLTIMTKCDNRLIYLQI